MIVKSRDLELEIQLDKSCKFPEVEQLGKKKGPDAGTSGP